MTNPTVPMTTPAAPASRPGAGAGRRPRRAAVSALAFGAVLALGLGACGGDDDDAAGTDTAEESGGAVTTAAPADDGYGTPTDAGAATTEAPAAGGAGGGAVAYEVSAIRYNDVTAPAGGTIEVANSSGAPHTFTADAGAFDVAYEDGETATVQVPAEPGEYAFHCEIHAGMQATVTAE